jgi:hypothetical protein
MKPLSQNNIESELSYVYLHAVAAKAGVACEVAGRHEDNAGVDAKLTGWGPFPGGGYRTEIDIKVQLKATIQTPVETDGKLPYFFNGVAQFDDLRLDTVSTPRLLVVLFLPEAPAEWLTLTEDALLLRKCAYWLSLRGAPATTNKTGQTIYLPKKQIFDPAALLGLMSRLSHNKVLPYEESK